MGGEEGRGKRREKVERGKKMAHWETHNNFPHKIFPIILKLQSGNHTRFSGKIIHVKIKVTTIFIICFNLKLKYCTEMNNNLISLLGISVEATNISNYFPPL